jgi:hypothetical protein
MPPGTVRPFESTLIGTISPVSRPLVGSNVARYAAGSEIERGTSDCVAVRTDEPPR